ncbi:MAG: ABC transporter substrate-binding protein [Pseudonocardiaceae bacterium]
MPALSLKLVAWAPEPWASRLVQEAGAKVLVDEKDLWPEGKFVTTHLIVRTESLEQHPETVEALLRGHIDAVQ